MSDDYDDGYERGYAEGEEVGIHSGYKEGFSDGYDQAEENTKDIMTREHDEHIERLSDAFGHKIDALNSQIAELKKEMFELRIAHAATTRTISECTR